MRLTGWLYIIFVMLTAALITGYAFWEISPSTTHWTLMSGTLVVTTLLRLYRVQTPNHQAYEGSTIGFVAAIFLLPLHQFILLVLFTHAVEWIVALLNTQSDHLHAWYIQPFNVAKTILSALPAYLLLAHYSFPTPVELGILELLYVLLIGFSFVIASQLVLGLALLLARGISFQQAGILRDGAMIEIPLAMIGLMSAFFYICNPLLVFLVFAPIVLIYQSFLLPKLQQEAFQSLERFNTELTIANQAIKQVNDELFLTLAKIFDARDPYVGGHAAQVASYAVAIGEELGFTGERLEVLRQAGYLHDIGKIAIPESILHKPGKLTNEEYELLKHHANIGADFIETSQGLRNLAPFIRHHHERWDGRGYPAQLAGEEIPLEARILNVCDSVEAMASDRPYHRALSTEEIIDEIERCSGSQFDPTVAAAFVQVAARKRQEFIVNSARTVTRQQIENAPLKQPLNLKMLAEIYGMSAV